MGYDLYLNGEDPEGGPDYFRRNIWGMGPLRDALEETGMGYYPEAMPRFPSPADFGYVRNEQGWFDVGETGDEKAYKAACAQVLSYTEERPGINLVKLSDNSGWKVLRLECEGALVQWERAGSPTPPPFGDDWLPFLRAAARAEGFETW